MSEPRVRVWTSETANSWKSWLLVSSYAGGGNPAVNLGLVPLGVAPDDDEARVGMYMTSLYFAFCFSVVYIVGNGD